MENVHVHKHTTIEPEIENKEYTERSKQRVYHQAWTTASGTTTTKKQYEMK